MPDLEPLDVEFMPEDIESYDSVDEVNPELQKILDWADDKQNILPHLEKDVIEEIQQQVVDQYTEDHESMADWLVKYKDAIDLSTMKKGETKTKPFVGASQVMAPYLMEACIDFNSRFMIDILGKKEPAAFEQWGKNSEAKEEQAKRCKDYFNYELTEDSIWIEDTDKEALALPMVGTTYKKSFHSSARDRVESRFVAADRMVFDFTSPRFEDAPQHAHDKLSFSINDVVGNVNSGAWSLDIDDIADKTDITGREYHFWFDLDGDGYSEPYIAVILDDMETEADGEKTLGLVSLVAAFDKEDVTEQDGKVTYIERIACFSQKQYLPDPEGIPMGMGWGILYADIFKTINTNMRQLVNAGTIHNNSSNSGLISSNISPALGQGRTGGKPIDIKMGKLTRVQTGSGQSLRDSVLQLPFSGPSVVLFQLLQHLEEGARRSTSAAYNVEANPNEAASLYLARLQQALKVPNAVMARVIRGVSKEFKIISNLIYRYGDNDHYGVVLDEENVDIQKDFNPDTCNVQPTADLSHGSDVERMARASAALETSLNPMLEGVANKHEAFKDWVEAHGADPEQYVIPVQEGPSEQDKLNMAQQASMAELVNREMMLKEQKLSMDKFKLMLESQKTLADLEQQAAKTGAEVDLKQAQTAKVISDIAVGEFHQQMSIVEKATERLAIQEEKANADQERRGRDLAGTPGNEGLPSTTI